ncbi:uncharacterized protein LOC144377127 [Ictidomys tridecemlineatus]
MPLETLGLDPNGVHFNPVPEKPRHPAAGSWARPRPLPPARRCAPRRETSELRAWDAPRTRLPGEEEEPAGPRPQSLQLPLTAVRRGRENVRSEGPGPSATRRSQSSARPPGNRRRRRRHHRRYRPPLRAQRAEGPTASHAVRRQRLAPNAPPSSSAHLQTKLPL